jgi:hypothetical protein
MLSISFNYRPLFTFHILHEYYANEIQQDLFIVPTDQSARKAKSMGFILKQVENKVTLSFEEDKMELLNFFPIEELVFSFFIYNKNPYFNNFTQLPIEIQGDKILYFSNRNDKKEELPSGKIHKQETVSEKDFVDVSWIKQPFSAEYPLKKPIAFVEIAMPKVIQTQIADFVPFRELTIANYFIKFSARKTYWKYAFVFGKRTLEEFAEITFEGLPVSFSRKGNETLLNKQEANIFVSDEPLVLKEFSDYNLKLIQRSKMSRDVEIIPRLPVPSVEMIKPESRKEDSKVFSEIVVYI